MSTTTMTCEQIREALKKAGKPIYGNKEQLFDRLTGAKCTGGICKPAPKKKKVSISSTVTSANVNNEVKMSTKLDDAMAKALGLTFMKKSGTDFIYSKVGAGGASAKKALATKTSTAPPAICGTISDKAMEEATAVCAWRLQNKMSVDIMKKILADHFDVDDFPARKAEIAELLSEQLHYETDDESDDDE